MSIASLFGLTETSEKTLEINILNEFSVYMRSQFGLIVTAIAPTQPIENTIGFDEILEGLPPGRVLALQFKRPYDHFKNHNVIRFYVDTRQLQILSSTLPQAGQAFLVLGPFPLNHQLISNRGRLLVSTILVDIQNIPRLNKITQQSRTLRVHLDRIDPRNGLPYVDIADPRDFEEVQGIASFEKIGYILGHNEIGIQLPVELPRREAQESARQRRKRVTRKLFFLHVRRQ